MATPPSAWQCVRDPQTERDYWWNTATNETAWEKPAEAAPQPLSAEADAGLSNEALDTLFIDYILTPQAKFDYPSPSAAFMELVEEHRAAIYERADSYFEFLNRSIDATADGGPPVSRSAGAPPLPVEAERTQSAAAAGIAMFDDENMRWNTGVLVMTRKAALESIRARLSNPALRDANPAF